MFGGTIVSGHTHPCTLTDIPAHTNTVCTICNPNLNRLQTEAYKGGKQQREKGKHGGSVALEKRNVLRLNFKESREGFFRRGRGRSFHVEQPKTEKAREPTVESLVRGIWRLRLSEAEQSVREAV